MSVTENLAELKSKIQADSPARGRIAMLLDPGSFVELDGYSGGAASGVVCGFGAVNGCPAAVFSQDRTADNGAMTRAHAAKIQKLLELALKTGVPVIGVFDSPGAKIAEGIGALEAYGELLLRTNNLSGVVPQIALVLGACAGTAALLAASADFVIMSEGSELFLNASEPGAAGNAAESGLAHIVCADEASAVGAARKLVSMLPLNNLSAAPVCEFVAPGSGAPDASCPAALAEAVADAGSVLELSAKSAGNAFTALATMGGYPCGIVITGGEKLCADCCRKIARFVQVIDSFQIPVLTFVNTSGIGSGALRESAMLAHVYAEATTAKIAVVTGKALGAAFIALGGRAANSDYTVAWPDAVIAPLEPQAAVQLLYADEITKDKPREAVEREYIENHASALAAAGRGAVDDIIEPGLTRPAVLAALDLLSAKRVQRNPKKHANIPL